MQTVCAPFVPQAAATHGKNLPAVVFQTAADPEIESQCEQLFSA